MCLIGSVKIDTDKRSYSLEQRYELGTSDGVERFLSNIHQIRQERNNGDIDSSTLLMTFMEAYKSAGLTPNEIQVIYALYDLQLTQEEAAERLDVSQQRVSQLTSAAFEKIAARIGGVDA